MIVKLKVKNGVKKKGLFIYTPKNCYRN